MSLSIITPTPAYIANSADDASLTDRMIAWMHGIDTVVLPLLYTTTENTTFLFRISDIDPLIGIFHTQLNFDPSNIRGFYMQLREMVTKICVAMQPKTDLCHFYYLLPDGSAGLDAVVATKTDLENIAPFMEHFEFFRMLCVRRKEMIGVEVGYMMLPEMWLDWLDGRF